MDEINLLILDLNIIALDKVYLVRQKLDFYDWYVTGIGECDSCQNKDKYFQFWLSQIPELQQIYLVQKNIDGNICHQYDRIMKGGYLEHCSYNGLFGYLRPGIGALTLIIKDHIQRRDLQAYNSFKLPNFRILLVSQETEFSIDQTSILFINKENWLLF